VVAWSGRGALELLLGEVVLCVLQVCSRLRLHDGEEEKLKDLVIPALICALLLLVGRIWGPSPPLVAVMVAVCKSGARFARFVLLWVVIRTCPCSAAILTQVP